MKNNNPMMEMTRRYGHTVYTISAFGSPDAANTYEDRLLHLIRHEAEKMDNNKQSTVNVYDTDGLHFSDAERNQLVQEITEAVSLRLQHMLPAFLAGYSAGAIVPASVNISQANTVLPQVTPAPNDP